MEIFGEKMEIFEEKWKFLKKKWKFYWKIVHFNIQNLENQIKKSGSRSRQISTAQHSRQ